MQKYDPSQVSISFLYTLKTSENQRFLMFSGDRERKIGLKKKSKYFQKLFTTNRRMKTTKP